MSIVDKASVSGGLCLLKRSVVPAIVHVRRQATVLVVALLLLLLLLYTLPSPFEGRSLQSTVVVEWRFSSCTVVLVALLLLLKLLYHLLSSL